jgi:hypothetical protein
VAVGSRRRRRLRATGSGDASTVVGDDAGAPGTNT